MPQYWNWTLAEEEILFTTITRLLERQQTISPWSIWHYITDHIDPNWRIGVAGIAQTYHFMPLLRANAPVRLFRLDRYYSRAPNEESQSYPRWTLVQEHVALQ
jgi:hypothetical protein